MTHKNHAQHRIPVILQPHVIPVQHGTHAIIGLHAVPGDDAIQVDHRYHAIPGYPMEAVLPMRYMKPEIPVVDWKQG